ncbi:MAG TPA: hypothetical protein ENI23_16850 [bacterium]|nr:hypothetical protein [bacterium]
MPAKLSLGAIIPYFEKYGATLLSKNYKNNYQKLKFQCKCSNVYFITWGRCSQGRTPKCRECRDRLIAEKSHRVPLHKIISTFEKHGAILTTRVYSNANQNLDFQCKCGNPYSITWKNLRAGQIPRCKECQLKFSIKRGSEHFHWNSELTDQDRARALHGRGSEFKKWCRNVIQKANYTCQLCGKQGKALAAHHLYNWADYPDKRYDLSNGIAIYKEHHIEFHMEYGWAKNTADQFSEYMEKYV